MNLTEEQRSCLSEGEWAQWTDPVSGQEFVLVPREQMEKMQAILGGMTRRAGWGDAALDVYEQYRNRP